MSETELGDIMSDKCDDKKCFKHGDVKVRGETLNGKVISAKGRRTVIVERTQIQFFPKYRKWARGTSRIAAHNPGCINAKVGDFVDLSETRKLSKTKAWTVTSILEGEHS